MSKGNEIRKGGVAEPYGIVMFVLLLLGLAVASSAQQSKTSPARTFEVVSLKSSGTWADHLKPVGDNHVFRWRPVEYKGVKLSCDCGLGQMVEFAYHPLLTPYRQETPDWMRDAFYAIDAIAPAGTTLDDARAMLRKVLAERMGLAYHVADRETPVFYLLPGKGSLKLVPSTEPEAGSPQSGWTFKHKAATIEFFAKFLSSVAGREVIDRTGIRGSYRFDVDWQAQLQQGGVQNGMDVILPELRSLGLKLEPGKESRKILVVDRANKIPTPN